jgi:hypothetical protein
MTVEENSGLLPVFSPDRILPRLNVKRPGPSLNARRKRSLQSLFMSSLRMTPHFTRQVFYE